MASFLSFVRDTITTPEGRPPDLPVEERIGMLDERMRVIEALTWTLVPAAVVVGGSAFAGIVRAEPGADPRGLARRTVVCAWSLVAIAMTKMWHAQEQRHVESMKELLVLRS